MSKGCEHMLGWWGVSLYWGEGVVSLGWGGASIVVHSSQLWPSVGPSFLHRGLSRPHMTLVCVVPLRS